MLGISLQAKVLTLGITHYVDKVVADVLNQSMHIQTREVNSSQENLNLLKNKQVDLAIIQGDVAYENAKKTMPNLRVIMALYPKMLAFITTKYANITSLKALKKKPLKLSLVSLDTQELCDKTFQALDINNSLQTLSFAQAQEGILSGKIDGFFSLEGHPNQATDTLVREHNLSLIPLFGKKFDQLKNDYPFIIKGGVPEGIYGLKKDAKSIGVKALLVTTNQMDTNTTYQITKIILENLENFKKANPVYRGMSKQHVLENLIIPQHQGATKAFNDF